MATTQAPAPAKFITIEELVAPFGWIAAGIALGLVTLQFALEKEVYLLAGLLLGYGLISHIAIRMARAGRPASMLTGIVGDFSGMPEIMIGDTLADPDHAHALPRITVDPETYRVYADGELLTCEPAVSLPMTQRYFLF